MELSPKLQIQRDLMLFMNEERRARFDALVNKAPQDLTPQEVDEFNGIAWFKIQLLILLGANTADRAFTEEGLEYKSLIDTQQRILTSSNWREHPIEVKGEHGDADGG